MAIMDPSKVRDGLLWGGLLLLLFAIRPGFQFDTRLDVLQATGMATETRRFHASAGWMTAPLFEVRRTWRREEPIANQFPNHPVAPAGAGKPITETIGWEWEARPIGWSAGALVLGIIVLLVRRIALPPPRVDPPESQRPVEDASGRAPA
jgi:hypothetical protein